MRAVLRSLGLRPKIGVAQNKYYDREAEKMYQIKNTGGADPSRVGSGS